MVIGITAAEVEKQLQERAALSNDSGKVEGKDLTKELDDEGKGEDDKDKDKDEENIPFHKHPRFVEMARQNREFKTKMAEIERKQTEDMKEAKKEFKLDPNMPFDEAILKIKQDAVAEALEAFRAEQNSTTSKISEAETLINDGFDYLRDSGIKVSAKDEDAIAEIALKYKIKIEQPEDLAKAYEIFDLSRKTAGAGKAKEDSILAKDRKTGDDTPAIDYSQTSWSNISGAISKQLGYKK